DRSNGSHLAAREAVVPLALEPQVGIVRLARSRARKDVLAGLGENGADRRGVNGLPASLAGGRLSSFPEAAGDLAGNHGIHHREFNVMAPDSAVVVAEPVVDASGVR